MDFGIFQFPAGVIGVHSLSVPGYLLSLGTLWYSYVQSQTCQVWAPPPNQNPGQAPEGLRLVVKSCVGDVSGKCLTGKRQLLFHHHTPAVNLKLHSPDLLMGAVPRGGGGALGGEGSCQEYTKSHPHIRRTPSSCLSNWYIYSY